MNCPGHVLIFNSDPAQLSRACRCATANSAHCHRNEPSGALHGIMRVRAFTQDDGHIFCTEEQIQRGGRRVQQAGARRSIADFGFADVVIKIALRPDQRLGRRRDVGSGRKRAAQCVARPAASSGSELPGEGAFYGPKVEYHLKDSIGRLVAMRHDAGRTSRCPAGWAPNTSTADDTRKVPVMLHRAIVGLARALHRHPDRDTTRAPCRCGWRRSRRWCSTSPTAQRPMPRGS